VKPVAVTKEVNQIVKSQNKQISKILDRISKFKDKVNAALLFMVDYKKKINHPSSKGKFIQCHRTLK
jgi:hypothetical protein